MKFGKINFRNTAFAFAIREQWRDQLLPCRPEQKMELSLLRRCRNVVSCPCPSVDLLAGPRERINYYARLVSIRWVLTGCWCRARTVLACPMPIGPASLAKRHGRLAGLHCGSSRECPWLTTVKPIRPGFGLGRFETGTNSKFKFKFLKIKNLKFL